MLQGMSANPWDTPELIAFREAARACYRAGECYRELKDILATEDELVPPDQRRIDPEDVFPGRLRQRE
jgi:hypothetical protein